MTRAAKSKPSKGRASASKAHVSKPAPKKAPAKKALAGKSAASRSPASKPAVRPVPAKAPAAKKPAARAVPKAVASSAPRGVHASGVTARAADASQLRVGDDIPAHTAGPLTRVDIARYSAASGTFNPITLDEPFARAAGLPSVVVPGGLAMALAGACLSRWLREDGRVVRFGARCVKMIWPGDVMTARARVGELRVLPDGRELDLDVWVENQKGELVLKGQAVCSLRAGEPSRSSTDFFGLPVPGLSRSAPVPPPPARPGRR